MRWGIALLLVTLSLAPMAFAMGDKPDTAQYAGKGNCIVGGCSGQLCTDAAQGPLMSTCEWREAYACYSTHGRCERQPSGECGWTPSAALSACLDTAQ